MSLVVVVEVLLGLRFPVLGVMLELLPAQVPLEGGMLVLHTRPRNQASLTTRCAWSGAHPSGSCVKAARTPSSVRCGGEVRLVLKVSGVGREGGRGAAGGSWASVGGVEE